MVAQARVMAVEIERKFLVADDGWRAAVTRSQRLVQGYLTRACADGPPCSVRIRIGAEQAWLNIKSAVAGVERREYEYAIPRPDAEQMLAEFCNRVVEKIRHYVPHAGRTFEIDEFFGDNAGLVVVELELESADERFDRPHWLGREVSDKRRYYNLHLLDHPYSRWSAAERAGD
jgi:adenylate cyclase